jgi:hypothetical protein
VVKSRRVEDKMQINNQYDEMLNRGRYGKVEKSPYGQEIIFNQFGGGVCQMIKELCEQNIRLLNAELGVRLAIGIETEIEKQRIIQRQARGDVFLMAARYGIFSPNLLEAVA